MKSKSLSLTAKDYENAFIGDRFRNIMDIIDLLRGFDLTKIKALLEVVGKIGAAPTLKAAVQHSLEAFKIIAEMTPTTADDNLSAIIDAILSDELLAIITRIIGGFLGQDAQVKYGIASVDGASYALTAAEKTDLEAKGIPLSLLFDIALRLLPLLERFLSNK